MFARRALSHTELAEGSITTMPTPGLREGASRPIQKLAPSRSWKFASAWKKSLSPCTREAEVAAASQWISQAIATTGALEHLTFSTSSSIVSAPRSRRPVRRILELSERSDDPGARVSIGTMHLAKGLEFKAVAVIGCDDEVLPRIEAVADEVDLDDVTKRSANSSTLPAPAPATAYGSAGSAQHPNF
jgi:hypothetical protein